VIEELADVSDRKVRKTGSIPNVVAMIVGNDDVVEYADTDLFH
jgi:hypothetical protein